jgi:NAD(P)-dependent dehydrogenase (short-subunit alcohol dehydrogenase family)
MTRLNGKTAVITGGATGIGRAAAKRFIKEGAFVFIFGRRQEALDAAVADLGPNARAVKGSVSDLADLDRLYAAVKAERGTLDIVFANAGAGSQLPLDKITAEQINEIFDTNVKGSIFTVQKALPLMGEGGSIILTGSSAGTTGVPAFSAYSASKAAVYNLAQTWAEDLKGTGIRVNVLSPGPTATELGKEALGEEGTKAFASMNSLQRIADPAELVVAAAFLASPDSSDKTASEVDGVRIVKEFFAAIDRVDEQGLVAVCAEDIEWTIPGQWAWAGVHRGLAGLKNLFKQAFETAEILTSERYEYIAQGDRIMVTGFATGRVHATNVTFDDDFVFSITVRNGKVSKIREYIDTQAVSQAFGPAAKSRA